MTDKEFKRDHKIVKRDINKAWRVLSAGIIGFTACVIVSTLLGAWATYYYGVTLALGSELGYNASFVAACIASGLFAAMIGAKNKPSPKKRHTLRCPRCQRFAKADGCRWCEGKW